MIPYGRAQQDPGCRQAYLDLLPRNRSVRGIAYVPSDGHLGNLVHDMTGWMLSDDEIGEYRKSDAFLHADMSHVGHRIPQHVFVCDGLFRHSEAEARIVLEHERFHADDFYRGIRVGKVELDPLTCLQLQDDVLRGVVETRAIVSDLFRLQRMELLDSTFGRETKSHFIHYYLLFGSAEPKTGLEEEIIETHRRWCDRRVQDFAQQPIPETLPWELQYDERH